MSQFAFLLRLTLTSILTTITSLFVTSKPEFSVVPVNSLRLTRIEILVNLNMKWVMIVIASSPNSKFKCVIYEAIVYKARNRCGIDTLNFRTSYSLASK